MHQVVAIQGEEGSNSSVAARELLGAQVQLLYCASFSEAFSALDGRATSAVLPFENTTAGPVQEVWDFLMGLDPCAPQVSALAEVRVPITFVAAGLKSTEQVQRILAHPVAAAQCRKYLRRVGWEVLPCHDTAGAARLVRERGDFSIAALCPPAAAQHYHLNVFDVCGDAAQTLTRFVSVVSGPAQLSPTDKHCVLSLKLLDQPGALARALTSFATRSLNLSALHSRAEPGSPGIYRFLLELDAGAGDPRCEDALAEVRASGAQTRVLGSWAR